MADEMDVDAPGRPGTITEENGVEMITLKMPVSVWGAIKHLIRGIVVHDMTPEEKLMEEVEGLIIAQNTERRLGFIKAVDDLSDVRLYNPANIFWDDRITGDVDVLMHIVDTYPISDLVGDRMRLSDFAASYPDGYELRRGILKISEDYDIPNAKDIQEEESKRILSLDFGTPLNAPFGAPLGRGLLPGLK